MAKETGSSGGIGHKIEHLRNWDQTATLPGGDPFERRVRNNYSKSAHKEQDRQGGLPPLPDISLARVLIP